MAGVFNTRAVRTAFALVASLTASLALTGCATVSTEGYRQHMALLVGVHSDQIQLDWGVPDDITTQPDGAQTFTYSSVRAVYRSVDSHSEQMERTVTVKVDDNKPYTYEESFMVKIDGPPEKFILTCDTIFVIGADHLVKSVDFHGDDCVAETIKAKTE